MYFGHEVIKTIDFVIKHMLSQGLIVSLWCMYVKKKKNLLEEAIGRGSIP